VVVPRVGGDDTDRFTPVGAAETTDVINCVRYFGFFDAVPSFRGRKMILFSSVLIVRTFGTSTDDPRAWMIVFQSFLSSPDDFFKFSMAIA